MFSCPNLNENCARKSRPFVVVITNWNCEVYVLELEWMKMIWWKANEESSAWRSEHPYPQLPDPTFHFPLLTSYTYASDLRPPKFSDQMMKSTGEWQLKSCCYSRINSPRIAFYFDRRRAPIFFGISSKTMDIKLSIVFVCFELYFRPENCGDGHTICHHNYFSRGSHVQTVFCLIPKWKT